VVRGEGGEGVRIEQNSSRLIHDTERWIAYEVKDTGFHFLLDKRVPGTMSLLAPAMRDMAEGHGWDIGGLDFYVVHAGGPRILDDLGKYLHLPPETFRYSRATLTERGNVASVVIFDALNRLFEDGGAAHGARGVIAGFGPGITAEISMGTWATAPRHIPTARQGDTAGLSIAGQQAVGGSTPSEPIHSESPVGQVSTVNK
jgi:1,3,6,8-tetrahydroxynaphthalene synthase